MNFSPFKHTQRGASVIEFAVTLPILLLILWGVVTFGTVLHARMVIARAAEDAARSISFFSAATTYSQLEEEAPSLLAPCTDLSQALPSLKCEALASLTRSLLIPGIAPEDRFDTLKEEVSINFATNTCGAGDDSSLGIEVRAPFAPLRILPPIPGLSGWIPTELAACAVIAL